jgi:hypothetical protein
MAQSETGSTPHADSIPVDEEAVIGPRFPNMLIVSATTPGEHSDLIPNVGCSYFFIQTGP